MKGENFTRIGLVVFFTGLVIFVTWQILYSREHDVIIDGKIRPQDNTSKALLTTGSISILAGYMMCVLGFVISSGGMVGVLNMQKNNLIEK